MNANEILSGRPKFPKLPNKVDGRIIFEDGSVKRLKEALQQIRANMSQYSPDDEPYHQLKQAEAIYRRFYAGFLKGFLFVQACRSEELLWNAFEQQIEWVESAEPEFRRIADESLIQMFAMSEDEKNQEENFVKQFALAIGWLSGAFKNIVENNEFLLDNKKTKELMDRIINNIDGINSL